MADQPAVVAGEANGASAAAAVTREALLAEMPFRDDSASAAEAEPAKAAKVEPAADEVAAKDPAEPTAEDIEADAAESEDDDKPDADTQKRLGLVERAEKRARQQLAAERREFEEERRTVAAEAKAIRTAQEKFEAAKKRAKHDPAAVLRELGLGDDDFEYAAQQIYALSKAGAADPKRRAAVEAAMRDREKGDELATLRREVEEMKKAREAAIAEATHRETREAWVASVSKEIDPAKSPLAARHLAKSPAKAHAMMFEVTLDLMNQNDGEEPSPAEVAAAYEKRRRTQLEDEGVDVDALIAKPAAAATEVKKSSKTLGSNLGSATPPAKPAASRTRADLLKEAVQELEAGTANLD